MNFVMNFMKFHFAYTELFFDMTEMLSTFHNKGVTTGYSSPLLGSGENVIGTDSSGVEYQGL